MEPLAVHPWVQEFWYAANRKWPELFPRGPTSYTRQLVSQTPSRPDRLYPTAGLPVSLEARPAIYPPAGLPVSLEARPAISASWTSSVLRAWWGSREVSNFVFSFQMFSFRRGRQASPPLLASGQFTSDFSSIRSLHPVCSRGIKRRKAKRNIKAHYKEH